jgi:pyrophosphatase PpaX
LIQHVIFDWDGTLVRSLDLWIDGYHAAFARRDLVYSPDEIVAEFFHEHDRVADRHPHLDFAVIADEARAHVRQGSARVALYDGAVETLAGLAARGITLSLVSSSPREVLQIGLMAHGLDACFASVLAGDDGFGHKPDPLPFGETLRRLGASAVTTLIIGDSHVDILAGQAAGCRTCLFAPAENRLFHDHARLRTIGADHDIAQLAEILRHTDAR